MSIPAPPYDQAAVLRVIREAEIELDAMPLLPGPERDLHATARTLAEVLARAAARVRDGLDTDDDSRRRNAGSLATAAADFAELVTVDLARLTPMQRIGAACVRCDYYLCGPGRTLGPPLYWNGRPVHLAVCKPSCHAQRASPVP
ncbi:hypothetical protein [Streptomyces litchfieldiae]|uniref:Uncharacterized protein n=1 Tax=Streptomyces litchfieldiae TaxID=3075543 RepID=A0ABU2MYL3_9ACTN|nr:hypothetical protein [Streptomyces sp. DSM 44938]MDT0346747.1 hypothetical protein [Streptomyces sp. DSM 44938]